MAAPIFQHTLKAPASFAGVGVHTGAPVRMVIRPSGPDTGVMFVRRDVSGLDNCVPARADAVCQTELGTTVGNAAGVTVSTVEHVMAALAIAAIDNAVIELDGPEAPVMDGSASPFVRTIDHVGLREQAAPRRYVEVLETVEVAQGDRRVALAPAPRFEVAVSIDFPTAVIGRQSVDLALEGDSFRQGLVDCRTFGFAHEVEALRSRGLALGGSLENAVVIDGDRLLNPEGLRRYDEPVRHKALDAVGDLYLLGAPLIGRYEAERAGHATNNLLVRTLLARPAAWRWRTLVAELAEAV